ncbi:hypothetical protein ACF0H5_001367 [Mactra antiquata]
MNTVLFSPDGSWWNLKGPHVPLDRATVVTKKVRKYTHENTYYTVLACASINNPGHIFYQLQISTLRESKRTTSQRRHFYIFNRLLEEFPIPTEIYEEAENKLMRKIDKRMLELLENKINSLDESKCTLQVSQSCEKPVKKTTEKKAYVYQKSNRKKKGKRSQKKSHNKRRGGNSKNIRQSKTRSKDDNITQGMSEVKKLESNSRNEIKDVSFKVPTKSSETHIDHRVDDMVTANTCLEQSENQFIVTTRDISAIQMLLRVSSYLADPCHTMNKKLVGNKSNALVKKVERKRERLFGFYVDVTMDTATVTFDIVDKHETMIAQLMFRIWMHNIVGVVIVVLKQIDNIRQALLPVKHRGLEWQDEMFTRNENELFVGDEQNFTIDTVAPNENAIGAYPDNDLIDDAYTIGEDYDIGYDADIEDNCNEYDDDDDEFIGGIMGVYCRSGIHINYSDICGEVDNSGD